MNNDDTICAIATATGGAIGIIRVSGDKAISIVDGIFKPKGKNKSPLSERDAYSITFGHIEDNDGTVIDEVLVSLFRAPWSYTGEDSVEISCHGSSYILRRVMSLLIDEGCRSAEPGEFTRRAFMNGKMDLSQAEAVADIIASSSETTHKVAMNQMRGGFSNKLKVLRDKLLHLTSLIELELDFSDHEDLEFADRSELSDITNEIEQTITTLTQSFKVGNAIKNGVPVTIIGETNAGKSTLMNALLNDDRSIVSDIHGTTRDVIEDTINIEGTTFRLIDTAGIRETHDKIESLGIERTFKKISQAEIVLLVIDATQPASQAEDMMRQILPLCQDKQLILVYNKVDLPHSTSKSIASTPQSNVKTIEISAKQNKNIDSLKKLLATSISIPAVKQDDVIITNVRHYEALSHSLSSIRRVQDGLSNQLSGDLISQDLRETISHLSEITGGEITSSEVLQNIFSRFCIGK